MRISLKTMTVVLLAMFGVSLLVLRSMAACNSPNGEVYSFTDLEIDMTSPDKGAVYKEDVCYFRAVATTDNPLVTGGFNYIWVLDGEPKKNSAVDTFSTKFSEGEHEVFCSVEGPGTPTVSGGCIISGEKEVVSKPYKLEYNIVSHAINSPINQRGSGYIGISLQDKSEVTIRVTLVGNLPDGQTSLCPEAELVVLWDNGVQSSATETSGGSYQPEVTEENRGVDIAISIQLTDREPPIFASAYIQKSCVFASTSPNNVGGASEYGSLFDTVFNPEL